MLQSSLNTQMQGKKKGYALGKKKQIKDVRFSQRAISSKEVHKDATPILIVNMNASKHITNSRPPHLDAPFFFPLGMPSPNFESMHPFHFTLARPTPLVLPSHKPLGWHCIELPLS